MSAVTVWPSCILNFVRLGRPLFLAGGFVMHGLGLALALHAGVRPLSLGAVLWGQISITATQLMTHYANDYFDLAADRQNPTPTAWSGGSRVLPDGLLAPRVALVTSLVLGAVALASALVLGLFIRPWPLTLPLLLLALVLAWGYSGPPLRLHARGLGQFTATLVVTGLTPLLGYYLQAGRLDLLPLLAILPVCCLQFAMLLAVDLPDARGDEAAAKHTLVVRIGAGRAVGLYVVLVSAAYALLPLFVLAGLPALPALAFALTSPVAAWQVSRVVRGAWADTARWSSLIFWSIGLLIAAALLETAAFLWLAL